MPDKKKWEQLTKSYDNYFRFAKTLEMGLPIVTALEFVSNEDRYDISQLLGSIADQLDDEVEDKKMCATNMENLISKLNASQKKDMIIEIFESLSGISKFEASKSGKPRSGKSPRRLQL
jgi:hypothetical protein